MPRFSANLSMLFQEHDFLDRFDAAARAGFEAVEYISPYEYPADEIAERLHGAGLRQVLFNLPVGDWAAGERGRASAALPCCRTGSRNFGSVSTGRPATRRRLAAGRSTASLD